MPRRGHVQLLHLRPRGRVDDELDGLPELPLGPDVEQALGPLQQRRAGAMPKPHIAQSHEAAEHVLHRSPAEHILQVLKQQRCKSLDLGLHGGMSTSVSGACVACYGPLVRGTDRLRMQMVISLV